MDVLMPQLGETVAEGKISKWFVAAGDAVKPGDNLFEIETDKVSMEVPSIAAGTLSVIHVQAGEVAPVGAVVAIIAGKGETVSLDKPQAPPTPAKAGVQKSQELDSRLRGNEQSIAATLERKPPVAMEPFREVRSPERNYGPARLAGGTVTTPLARRLAGEAGIDLANVKGSGPHGRIVARDVETARAKPAATAPAAARTVAHIVLTADVEIGESLALCAAAPGIELVDVFVKAWAAALARVTQAEHSDIAIVAGKSPLVIRAVETKSLSAIAAARRDPGSPNATSGPSTAIFIADISGIASIAGVLQPPQTTLLSIGSRRRAAVEAGDGLVTFVNVITATLSCDSRAVDATLGAALLSDFKRFVEQPVMMIV